MAGVAQSIYSNLYREHYGKLEDSVDMITPGGTWDTRH